MNKNGTSPKQPPAKTVLRQYVLAEASETEVGTVKSPRPYLSWKGTVYAHSRDMLRWAQNQHGKQVSQRDVQAALRSLGLTAAPCRSRHRQERRLLLGDAEGRQPQGRGGSQPAALREELRVIAPSNVGAILDDLGQRAGVVGVVAVSGEEFVAGLPTDWHLLELGERPHVVLAARDGVEHELALYVHEHLSVEYFATAGERDACAQRLAHLYSP